MRHVTSTTALPAGSGDGALRLVSVGCLKLYAIVPSCSFTGVAVGVPVSASRNALSPGLYNTAGSAADASDLAPVLLHACTIMGLLHWADHCLTAWLALPRGFYRLNTAPELQTVRNELSSSRQHLLSVPSSASIAHKEHRLSPSSAPRQDMRISIDWAPQVSHLSIFLRC